MRRAQRAYRARKEKALNAEKARAEQLSRALDEVMVTFTKLHQRVLEFHEIQNSPELLLHLNEAVTEMTAIAHGACKQARFSSLPETSPPSAHQKSPGTRLPAVIIPGQDESIERIGLTSGHIPHQSSIPDSEVVALSLRTNGSSTSSVSERISRACVERTVSILASGSDHGSEFPALSIPLQLLGAEALMINAFQILPRINLAATDFQYLPHSAVRLPQMYRVVEGESNLVPRLPAPSVQQILRGKTRTRLMTNIKSLQGEWLEAMDVEEYLEERGIYLRCVNPNGKMSRGKTESQYFAPAPGQNGSLLVNQNTPINIHSDPVIQSPGTGFVAEETQQLHNGMEHGMSMVPSQYLSHHELADHSVFGIPCPPSLRTSAQPHLLGVRGFVPPNLQLPDLSLSSHQDAQVSRSTLQITIDLDKLVQLLAANATCLGPFPGIQKAGVDYSIRESVVMA